MEKQEKLTQSQIDGVQYRRAKLWQIILVASSGMVGMGFYCLIGLANYSANIGFGIATVALGGILTFTRVFDAITDPLLAFIYDKVNTRFGKVRILLVCGWLVMVFATLLMYSWAAGKGHGFIVFVLLYMFYIIGYTLYNMTGQTLFALMTNDPKQRPMVGVWSTVFNYVVPMVMNMLYYVVLMPKYGDFNLEFLTVACWATIAISAVGLVTTCIGISEFDKPENFVGTTAKREKLRLKDMIEVLKNNRPLQCYIVSGASDKIAQQVSSQSIINTMLGGIIIGDMSISTTLMTVSIIPSILFAVVGAKYAGKHGNKKTIITWTYMCIYVTCSMILFFVFMHMGGATRSISTAFPLMAIYVILTLALNGTKMCVTTGNNAFMADVIDYELDRGGKYIPAVVSGVYSLIDKLVSSVSALIATSAVALIGYRETMPQPTDELTSGVFWMTLVLMYGFPLIGWVITLIAMRYCSLDKEEMVEVQKCIADKKAAALKR